MALPPSYQSVPVHGHYVDLEGNPVAGRVSFTPTPVAMNAPEDLTIIMGKPLVVELVAGEFTVLLPATDDPDIDPTGFTYLVEEKFSGPGVKGRIYSITVPMSALPGGVDLSLASPAIPVPGITRAQTLDELANVDLTGEASGMALVLDVDGVWKPVDVGTQIELAAEAAIARSAETAVAAALTGEQVARTADVDAEEARARAAELTKVPLNDLSSFGIYLPEKYGTCPGDGTDVTAYVSAALTAAMAVGGQLRFLDKQYVTEMQTVNAPCSIEIPHRGTVKLKSAAAQSGGMAAAFRITSSDVSLVCHGWIDANRAGQDKTAFNAAGGPNGGKYLFGVRVQGSAVTPLSNVKVEARIKNSVDMAFSAFYTSNGDFQITATASGAGVLVSDSTEFTLDAVLTALDNDGWKVFPHAYDVIRATGWKGSVISVGQHGSGGKVAGTALSDFVSGVTIVASDNFTLSPLRAEMSPATDQARGVGVSVLGSSRMTASDWLVAGYNEVQLEAGGLVDSELSNAIFDGRYAKPGDGSLALGRGIAMYDNGFYPDFASRSTRPTERLKQTNVTIMRHCGDGLDLWNARDCDFVNVRSNGNRVGLLSRFFAIDEADNFTQVVRDLDGHRFIGCDFSYNETHGVWGYDLRDSGFTDCRANNNGQAYTFGAARTPGLGSIPSDASGFKTAPSTSGLVKSGLRWASSEAQDTQTWTESASPNPANPAVVSVRNPSRYNPGQTIKLAGAGAAGADLLTRVNDVTNDEITVSPAPTTLATVAGTGTLASAGVALTGVGTVFTTELNARYWIVAGGQTRQIAKVATDTSGQTTAAFAPALPAGTAFTIYKTITAGVPSQKYGVQWSLDTISPRMVGGVLNGNVTANLSDGTATATKGRVIGVAGIISNFQNSLTSDALVRAVEGTSEQTAIGGVGPGFESGISFKNGEFVAYRSAPGVLYLLAAFKTNSMIRNAVTKTASYTATTSDHLIDVNGAGLTITFPSAATALAGREYIIKNSGASNVTVAATAGTTVEIATVEPGAAYTYVLTGTVWLVHASHENMAVERAARVAADNTLTTAVAAAQAKADAAIPLTQRGAANGVATLDGNGVIPTSQIPALALGTAVPVVDQAAMLALTAAQVQPGDLALRADGAGTFMLMAADPSVLANWRVLPSPTDAVTSVNGQIGTVVLAYGDVGAVSATDIRLTDTRTPTDGTVTLAKIVAGGLAPSAITGTAVVTADARLSDTRTPTDGSVTTAKVAAGGLAPSAITGTAVITTDSRLADQRVPSDGSVTLAKMGFDVATQAELDAAIALQIPLTQKGAASGVASLDSTGHITLAQARVFARPRGEKLTSGEATLDRRLINTNTNTLSSGNMRLCYFEALETETINSLKMITGSTAATLTTLMRMGIFTVAANGDLTLVASTPNDTTLLAAATTAYTKALSVALAKAKGTFYAFGALWIGTGTAPAVCMYGGTLPSSEFAVDPRVVGLLSGQTDLPGTVAAGSVGNTTVAPYGVLLP